MVQTSTTIIAPVPQLEQTLKPGPQFCFDLGWFCVAVHIVFVHLRYTHHHRVRSSMPQ